MNSTKATQNIVKPNTGFTSPNHTGSRTQKMIQDLGKKIYQCTECQQLFQRESNLLSPMHLFVVLFKLTAHINNTK